MILEIFSVHDSKAEAYLTPFFFPTIGLAMRSFAAAANDQTHDFNKYAGDYTLHHLGSFDQKLAKFTSLKNSTNLGSALTFIDSNPS